MERDVFDDLAPYFDRLDVTPSGHIGHFAFVIPNDAASSRWPDYPIAARIESGRAASGRGLSAAECLTSGLGEAIELASACEWKDDELLQASLRDLGPAAIAPDVLLGFSKHQVARRSAWNASMLAGIDWIPPDLASDRRIDWVKVTGATSEPRFVPADLVHIGRVGSDPEAIGVATTAGCAAGRTHAAARFHALLELIERDSVGTWWYGGRLCPLLRTTGDLVPIDVTRSVAQRGRRITLYNLTSDIGVPVVVAVSFDSDGSHVALGFAARPTLASAARDAVVEMLQTEIAIDQRLRQADQLAQYWVRSIRYGEFPLVEIWSESTSGAPAAELDLNWCIESLGMLGHDVFFADLTRPSLGIPAYRAIVPGLCSDKPRHRLIATRLRAQNLPSRHGQYNYDKFLAV